MAFLLQLIVFTFFTLFLWKSFDYPFEVRLYPQVITLTGLTLVGLSLFQHLKQGKGTAPMEDVLRRARFYRISLILIAGIILGFLIGFLGSVLFYYIAYAYFQGERKKLPRNLLIGTSLTFFFYLLFGYFMGVPLFRGMIKIF